MLKIGDFSKLSRVSIRMLRYYDEIGLLKPVETDRFTDYRYYSEAQLPTVCRIKALRDMGLGLADIRAILPVYDDPERLDALFAARETPELFRGERAEEAHVFQHSAGGDKSLLKKMTI